MCDFVRHTRESYHTPVFMYVMELVISFEASTLTVSSMRRRPQKPQRLARNYWGAIAHGTPLSDDEQCALQVSQGPGTGDRSYLLGGTGRPVIRTTGMGADRCSVAVTGGGGR